MIHRVLRLLIVGLAALTICVPLWAQQPTTPAAAVTGVVYTGATPLLPKFAAISAAANGNNTLVAAVSGKKIRVLAASFTMTGTAVTLTLQDGASGTGLSGAMGPTQGQTIVWPFNPLGWVETSAGTLLNLSLSGAQSVTGVLVYVEV